MLRAKSKKRKKKQMENRFPNLCKWIGNHPTRRKWNKCNGVRRERERKERGRERENIHICTHVSHIRTMETRTLSSIRHYCNIRVKSVWMSAYIKMNYVVLTSKSKSFGILILYLFVWMGELLLGTRNVSIFAIYNCYFY